MLKLVLPIFLSLFCWVATISANKTLNPIQFGFFEAKTSTERYYVLYKTHCKAKKTNSPVSYKGIQSIELEIPSDAKRIPLTDQTDFAGAKFYVKNNFANTYLFEMSDEIKSIEVSKTQIDSGNFTNIPLLSKGRFLLVVEDSTPWVKQRKGYIDGAIRKDLLLIKNGKALNEVVSPYSNSWTEVRTKYRLLQNNKKRIANLYFFRQPGSTKITFLATISNQDNVILSNIEVHTPSDSLVNDAVFSITNSTNVKFDHVTIDGTYSRKDHSGYGILMNNVWNTTFYKLYGHGNWGVFGANNVNFSTLIHCDINRFDIHCYGRDVYFEKCTIRNVYNQFSSVFGKVVFNRCEFRNCFPVAFGASYNAYTKFNLVVKDCVVKEVNSKNSFILMNGFSNPDINERPELKNKEWPDININGLTIFLNDHQNYRLSNYSGENILTMKESIPTHIKLKRIKYKKIQQ